MIRSQDAAIAFGDRTIGKVRVKQVYAHPALYPAIQIVVGVAITNLPDHVAGPSAPLREFEMRGLEGELRLRPNATAIGPVRWLKDNGSHIRSSDTAFEYDAKLVCDLDPYRLHAFETRRSGASPSFSLHLWTLSFKANVPIEMTINPLEFDVALETWTAALSAISGDGYELLEVRYKAPTAQDFQKALSCIASAKANRDRSAYNTAVEDCRMAIEALQAAVGLTDKASEADWQRIFERGTKARAAKEFAKLLTAAKGLGHIAHHYRENPDDTFRPDYSRVEAVFIIRVCEELIGLVSELTANRSS